MRGSGACPARRVRLVEAATVLRAEKTDVIDDLHATFGRSGVVVVTHYSGLTVAEMDDLRGRLRGAGASFRVSKNRLTKLALDGTGFAAMAPLMRGPTGLAYSADPTAAPKAIVEYARRNDKLKIVGGGIAGVLLDQAAVRTLAELQSLDELRAKLIALLQTPASRLVGLLQAPGGQVARVLAAYSDKAA